MFYFKWFNSDNRYGRSSLATEGVIIQSLMKQKEELQIIMHLTRTVLSVWYTKKTTL